MPKINEALTYGLTIRESANDGTDFTNPAADYRRLFLGEDGQLHVKDSAGAVTDIGIGGDVATDAIWDAAGDLAVGSGANTAAKLTKGSDLDVLTISASTHVPVWAAPAAGGGITVEEEGTPLATIADTLDFVGAGVVASGTGTTKTITIAGGAGLSDQGEFTYLDATEGAAPGTPAAGFARVYAKTDGRIYSKDDGGTEYGPFDAAGAGFWTYDTLFPGSSLPSGWAFTGSGTCVVSGNKATVTGAAQKDRLMYGFTPPGQYVLQIHITNLSGTGGMPSLVVLDANGDGYGSGPYNDGNSYIWSITNYAYVGNANTPTPASPSLTDVWWQLHVVAGVVITAAFSTNLTTWTGMSSSATTKTMTQFGLLQVYTAANMSAEVVEVRYCVPA